MVLGDLNDEVEAATTQILNGPPGSEIATTGFNHPDQGDVQRLWNLAPRIPEAQRFSRKYWGRSELIDHIFVSHALVGKIAQDHVTTTRPDRRPPSTTTPLKDAECLGQVAESPRACQASVSVPSGSAEQRRGSCAQVVGLGPRHKCSATPSCHGRVSPPRCAPGCPTWA